MSNTPEIRFEGFTDAWEQRKLGDVVERITRKNTNLESERPLTISAQYGLIDQNEFFDKRVASKDVSGYYLVKNGEFAYNKSTSNDAPWGAIKRLDKYENGVLSTLYIVFKVANENMTDSNYIACYYDTSLWHRDVKMIAAEGARNHGLLNITPDDFFQQTTIKIPTSKEEQFKIGEYFSQLDNAITLNQRKAEQYKTLKKYMLQNMFPKNGEKVPEIRFEGFTDAWEQRKLGELAEKTYGGGTPATSNEEFWNGDIPWIQSSDISDGKLFDITPRKYITKEAVSKSATQLVPENSIAIVTRVGVGKLAFMPFSYTTSQDFLSLSKLNTDPQFTVYALYKKLQSELNAVQGTSIKGITKNELLAKEIMVPSIEEQKPIGDYFHALDNLITLHQRKSDEFKTLKKYMLQKMFPKQ